MKLFNNPKPVVFAIVGVIILFVAYKAKATEMEFGPTFAGEFNGGYALSLIERFSDKIDVGVTLVGEQKHKGLVLPNNGRVFVAFVAQKPDNWYRALPTEVGIGATHWVETSRFIGCQQGYVLRLKWRYKNASIGIDHSSNAGICKPNHGQDLVMFGWRF